MKIKRKRKINRSFQSKAPKWIEPIYDTVQEALNSVLGNKQYTNQLIKLKLTKINKDGTKSKKARGTLWHEIQAIIGNPLKGKINNAAWYNRILMTNILSLIKSHQDQVKIYKLLEANQFQIDQVLRSALTENDLYPTTVALNSLARAKKVLKLPKRSILKLNYAFSDPQMFIMDENYRCHIQVLSKRQAKKLDISDWKSFQIYLPGYLRTKNLVKICKPVFIYSKKLDQIICQVPYQIKPITHPKFKNILGIDLGKVKLYSGTVVYPNGFYSPEFIPSRQLTKLNEKHQRLNQHVDAVYQKMQRCKEYKSLNHQRQTKRSLDYEYGRKKRTRLKEHIEWLLAEEIVNLALRKHCGTIHFENLTWINNQGGKWDFSQIVTHVNYLAELHSLKIKLINPKNTSKRHPVIKDLGLVKQRNIIFKNLVVDRDQLAGLNIALAGTKIKLERLVRRNGIKNTRVSRRRQNYLCKQHVLKAQKKSQIVVFLRKITGNNLVFTSLNKNIVNLDNNLAFRHEMKLLKLITSDD